MTLFEINEALRNYEEIYDEETGEWLNEDELDQLNIARDAKIEGIGCLIKEYRAQSKALVEESKVMKKRAESADKKADNLEKWLSFELQNKPYSTPRVNITFRRSETTDIIEVGLLPEIYVTEKVKTELVPDKAKIKKDIKSGIEVPGAVVTEHFNIQVR